MPCHDRGVRTVRGARVTAVLVATAVVAGCAAAEPPPELRGDADYVAVRLGDAPAVPDVVDATWELGLAALAAADGDAGAVVSPSSLTTALAMLAEAGEGPTEEALDAALGASGQDRTDAVGALVAALRRLDGDPAAVQARDLPEVPVVHTAQRVVVDDGAEVDAGYLDRLTSAFDAGVLRTDLGSDAGTDALGAWVREHTGGLVEDSAVVPDASLVAVLQDAVVVAAAWEQPFTAEATGSDPFHVPGAAAVDVPTMHGAVTTPLVELDGWQAVRMRYGYAGVLHADLLLPPAGSPAAADPARSDLTQVRALGAALDDAADVPVDLALPQVGMRSQVDLGPVLDDLGLAPLTVTGLLADDAPATLGQARQQAVLLVDEAGTRAAAATELGMAGGAPPPDPVAVVLDRPFLLVVSHTGTGWPVLLASVRDPRG